MKAIGISMLLVFITILTFGMSFADDRPRLLANEEWIKITDNIGFIITKMPIEPKVKKEAKKGGGTSYEIIKPGDPKAEGYFIMKSKGKWYPINIENPALIFPIDKRGARNY